MKAMSFSESPKCKFFPTICLPYFPTIRFPYFPTGVVTYTTTWTMSMDGLSCSGAKTRKHCTPLFQQHPHSHHPIIFCMSQSVSVWDSVDIERAEYLDIPSLFLRLPRSVEWNIAFRSCLHESDSLVVSVRLCVCVFLFLCRVCAKVVCPCDPTVYCRFLCSGNGLELWSPSYSNNNSNSNDCAT